jgi:hypothetical protein
MSVHLRDDELQRRKRDERLRIARLRRRIDSRLRAAEKHSRQLLSWRTYATRYPAWMMLAALATGMAASAGLRSRHPARLLGVPLLRRALQQIRRYMWRDLQRVWTESTASSAAKPASKPSPGSTDG